MSNGIFTMQMLNCIPVKLLLHALLVFFFSRFADDVFQYIRIQLCCKEHPFVTIFSICCLEIND